MKDACCDHFHRFLQNLHGPQVRTCSGKLGFHTCSSKVPNSSGWKISSVFEQLADCELDESEEEGDGERAKGFGEQGVTSIGARGDDAPSDAAGEEWWEHATGDETTDSSIGEDAAIESATGDDGAAESERGVDGTVELHTPSSEEEASEDEAKLDMACLNYLAAVAFTVAVPAECLRRNACGC